MFHIHSSLLLCKKRSENPQDLHIKTRKPVVNWWTPLGFMVKPRVLDGKNPAFWMVKTARRRWNFRGLRRKAVARWLWWTGWIGYLIRKHLQNFPSICVICLMIFDDQCCSCLIWINGFWWWFLLQSLLIIGIERNIWYGFMILPILW